MAPGMVVEAFRAEAGLGPADGLMLVDPASPDGDPAKFVIDGKIALPSPPATGLT